MMNARTDGDHYKAAEVLRAALDAAATDAERLALLEAAPRRVREALNAQLIYTNMHRDTAAACAAADAAYEGFCKALDEAPSDEARMAVITAAQDDPARGPSFLAEWNFRRTASVDDWARRYFAMLGVEGYGSSSENG